MEEKDEDSGGFEIKVARDGPRACPNIIIISTQEKDRLNKPLKKTPIKKILGREIGFQALESKLVSYG